jgi:site-specific DNA recombinase
MPLPLVILAYMRASTTKQELDVQLDLLQRAGFDELYQEHISGTRGERPQFRAMVDRALELSAKGQQVEVLVVNDSRFARDVITSLSEIERLEAVGCRIRTIEGGAMSLATPEDFLLTVVKAATAQHYSLNLSREIRKRNAKKRKDGLPLCNRVPWPYRRGPDGKLEPDVNAWSGARDFVDRLLNGDSIGSCLDWLRETQGIQKSRAWVRLWVHNPLIRGHTAYTIGGRSKAEKGIYKPTTILYHTHPALVTEAEYEALARGFVERRGRRGANANATIYPVPSIVWCSCSRKAIPTIDPAGVRRFRCHWQHCPNRRPSTRQDAIEAAIQEAILESAEMIATAVLATADGTDPRIAAWEAEIEQLRPLAARPAIAAEIEAIELEIAHAKAAQGHQAAGEVELREKVLGLQWLEWEALTPETRRSIYAEIIERVTIEGGEVLGVEVRGV